MPQNTPSKYCMLSSVKNEAIFLLEWIAHHRAIGFETMVIAANDCDDGTDMMLERLDALGFLTYIENTLPTDKPVNPQRLAIDKMLQLDYVKNSEWCMSGDTDEFMTIRVGNGNMDDLMARLPDDANNIMFQWRAFGDSGHETFPDGDVCDNFHYTQSSQSPCSNTVKTMFRHPWRYDQVTEHGPRGGHRDSRYDSRKPIYMSDGTEITAMHLREYTHNRLGNERPLPQSLPGSWGLVYIAHHGIRTRDVFSLRQQRGDNRPGVFRYSQKYFNKWNKNEEFDDSIMRSAPQRKAMLAKLREDPELRRLELRAWEIAREKIERAKNASESGT